MTVSNVQHHFRNGIKQCIGNGGLARPIRISSVALKSCDAVTNLLLLCFFVAELHATLRPLQNQFQTVEPPSNERHTRLFEAFEPRCKIILTQGCLKRSWNDCFYHTLPFSKTISSIALGVRDLSPPQSNTT